MAAGEGDRRGDRSSERAAQSESPDQRVTAGGDLHGNFRWLDVAAGSVQTLAPGVWTMLQLGDWWMDPGSTDEVLDGTGIEKIYVTLGTNKSSRSAFLTACPSRRRQSDQHH